MIATLLGELPLPVPADLIEQSKILDNFYIANRHANGHPAGAPFEHYGSIQSNQAIAYARAILDFVHTEMAQRPDGR